MIEAPLQDRLRQWVALEPERCRESEEMFDVFLEGSWLSVFSLRISPNPSASGWAIIQAVAQEAIHARKWRFRITDASNHYGNKIACYEVDVMSEDFDYFVEREYTDPAFGLFDAYVEALELQKSFEQVDEEDGQ